jgi:hypothetical protein
MTKERFEEILDGIESMSYSKLLDLIYEINQSCERGVFPSDDICTDIELGTFLNKAEERVERIERDYERRTGVKIRNGVMS